MTNYYKMQMMFFQEIDKLVVESIESRHDINVASAILDFSRRFGVSEKAVVKRLMLHCDTKPEMLKFKESDNMVVVL